MALARHVLHALVKPRVAEGDGGVAVVEELVDDLALLQPGQRPVLPEDGGHVRGRALQPLVAALQGPVAELQPLVKDPPELPQVPAGGKCHIRQVDGDDALVEAAVVFVLPGLIIPGVRNVADARVREAVRGQEGAAAHAGVDVALELPHLLLGDVVRHHPPGGALGRELSEVPVGGVLRDVVVLENVDELGEGRGHPDALLVLHALVALQQHLLNDEGQVVLLLLVPGLVQVHEDRDEGGLAVGGQQRHHLILDGLHALLDLVPQPVFHQLREDLLPGLGADGRHLRLHQLPDLLPGDVHEGRQVGQGDGLPAILVGGHLGDDLGRDVAGGGEAVGPLDEGPGDDGAVLQHVLQVHEVAVVHVLGEVVRVVEVEDALPVGLHDVQGQQNALRDVPAHLARHVVPLGGVHHRILVAVLLLGLLIAALDEGEDLLVRGVGLPDQGPGVAVGDVVLRDLIGAVGHDLVLHVVLDLLHRGGAVHLQAGELHALGDALDLHGGHADALVHALVGLGDGEDDLCDVKDHLSAVALDDFHASHPLSFPDSREKTCPDRGDPLKNAGKPQLSGGIVPFARKAAPCSRATISLVSLSV